MWRRILPVIQHHLPKQLPKSSCLPPQKYVQLITSKSCLPYSKLAEEKVEVKKVILEDIREPLKAKDEMLKAAREEIAALNEEDTRQLKIIKLEYDVYESMGHKVPQEMNDAMWLDLLKYCPTINARRRRHSFWHKLEFRMKLEMEKKEEKRIKREKQRESSLSGDAFELPNRFLRQIDSGTMNVQYYHNLYHAMMYGPHLVFDLGFDEYMNRKELKNLVTQLTMCHGANKVANEPYHMHFCNIEPNGTMQKYLETFFTGYSDIPVTMSSDSYLDHYSKDDLVYLTPNSRNVLQTVDPNKVYIIGGLIDLTPTGPVTFAKAKREGIRTAKLPLDRYTRWTQGSKSLALNQMISILLQQRATKDWRKALKHLPSRKVIHYD